MIGHMLMLLAYGFTRRGMPFLQIVSAQGAFR